ncbi:hypothetical protein [Streptomyces sp. NPDC047130]|uniref:hypothetical protein n=1 Tax=Streptomyces sp. NPDC047130 TaxID=3155261 RepID=UPI0033EA1F70
MSTPRPSMPAESRTPPPARVSRRPAAEGPAVRTTRLLAVSLAAGALCASAACSGGAGTESRTAAGPGERPAVAATTTPASPSPSPALTEEGARRALITEADIEDAWNRVEPATARAWRDRMLLGKVDAARFLTGKSDVPECRRLVDALFDETLLGRPSGASALTGFEQDDSRLLYQVAAYRNTDLDASMRWLRSLPQSCDSFTLTGDGGGERTVEVVETALPDEGDARQGLTVTVRGDDGGEPATLTLGVAVVRIGANAITITQGGLDGVEESTTRSAVRQGAQRLEDVLAGRTPSADPSVFD